ncbi:MAG TPA: dihydrofolate reductase [Pyrinomonadaceae bacterium]|nr:dihydrofolate reductase [Pyrinomonadaceae bacterium]
MAIIGIVAVAENLAIGKGGKLPWHYPADLKHFKQTTTGNAIVMGSNTWRSIGKPLSNRLNIVLSRRAQLDSDDNLIFLRNETEVADLAKYLKGDLYVIGGAHIYEALAPFINSWIVTEIPETVENADVFMPANYLESFRLAEAQELEGGLVVRRYERTL